MSFKMNLQQSDSKTVKNKIMREDIWSISSGKEIRGPDFESRQVCIQGKHLEQNQNMMYC